MTTWMTEQLARQHRTDLLAAAARPAAASPGPARPGVPARLGWLLIRVGWRLVALRPGSLDDLTAVHRQA